VCQPNVFGVNLRDNIVPDGSQALFKFHDSTIRYDKIEEFNVDSKAECDWLNRIGIWLVFLRLRSTVIITVHGKCLTFM